MANILSIIYSIFIFLTLEFLIYVYYTTSSVYVNIRIQANKKDCFNNNLFYFTEIFLYFGTKLYDFNVNY